MLHYIDSQKWRPLPSPLAIQKHYFIDNLNPRPGHVKFEVAQKVYIPHTSITIMIVTN